MSTTDIKKSDELKQILEQLERFTQESLHQSDPKEWLHQLHLHVSKSERLMRDVIREEHQELYKQIRRENNDLIRRVEQLRENDQHVLDEARQLLESAEATIERTARTGPSSATSEIESEEMDHLHRRLSVYAVAGRKHLDEVTHWFLEAFLRDRGVVD